MYFFSVDKSKDTCVDRDSSMEYAINEHTKESRNNSTISCLSFEKKKWYGLESSVEAKQR